MSGNENVTNELQSNDKENSNLSNERAEDIGNKEAYYEEDNLDSGAPEASYSSGRNKILVIVILIVAAYFLFNIFTSAQKEDEITTGLVHLLVDRIHTKKYGKQIFGSQQIWDDKLQKMVSVPLYSEKEIATIKKQYNLE